MDKLGAAIIGCGWVAEEYVKAFGNDERSEVRTLVSRNRANAERYRDVQYGAQSDARHQRPSLADRHVRGWLVQ